MSEKPMDLNALRDKMLKEKQEAPKTKEDQIQELKAQIERLENTPEAPSAYDVFQNLDPAEQQAEVGRLIGQGDRPDTYSIEDRAQELQEAVARIPLGSTKNLRLDILKHQLAGLENETADSSPDFNKPQP